MPTIVDLIDYINSLKIEIQRKDQNIRSLETEINSLKKRNQESKE